MRKNINLHNKKCLCQHGDWRDWWTEGTVERWKGGDDGGVLFRSVERRYLVGMMMAGHERRRGRGKVE